MMPLNSFFKSWRKEPETAKRCIDGIAGMLLDFAREIRAAGVKYISYSDPAGSRDILGPKYGKLMAEEFTLPFLKRLAEACGEEPAVTVCPLTAQALFSENLLAAAKAGEKGEIAAACVKRSGLPERRSFRLAGGRRVKPPKTAKQKEKRRGHGSGVFCRESCRNFSGFMSLYVSGVLLRLRRKSSGSW